VIPTLPRPRALSDHVRGLLHLHVGQRGAAAIRSLGGVQRRLRVDVVNTIWILLRRGGARFAAARQRRVTGAERHGRDEDRDRDAVEWEQGISPISTRPTPAERTFFKAGSLEGPNLSNTCAGNRTSPLFGPSCRFGLAPARSLS